MYLVVLFNLRPGVTVEEYEAWARSTDLPTVRGLSSIGAFDVFRTTGVMGSDAKPPYQYVEVIRIDDMETFGQQASSETMQKIAAEFQGRLADNPIFMTCDHLG